MRNFEPEDAPGLARLIQLIWPHNNPSPGRIARVSLDNSHVTLLETDHGSLIGFVDSFATVAQDGTVRWEIDLLGVHPDYRGRRIARGLVSGAAAAGRAFGAGQLRALVKIDNVASLRTFQHCGFAHDETIYDLCVSGLPVREHVAAPPTAHLVAVSTLTYSGVWIEGEQSTASLRCGQSVRARYGWDVAGAVIPAGTHTAETHGYEIAGQYHWLEQL